MKANIKLLYILCILQAVCSIDIAPAETVAGGVGAVCCFAWTIKCAPYCCDREDKDKELDMYWWIHREYLEGGEDLRLRGLAASGCGMICCSCGQWMRKDQYEDEHDIGVECCTDVAMDCCCFSRKQRNVARRKGFLYRVRRRSSVGEEGAVLPLVPIRPRRMVENFGGDVVSKDERK